MSTIHILRTKGSYIGQVRGYGCRRWRTVTGKCRSAEAALSLALGKMRSDDKRARALFMPNFEWSWYEPHIAMEAARS